MRLGIVKPASCLSGKTVTTNSALVTIPARAGSKGVKDKNLRSVMGGTLVDSACDIGYKFGVIMLTTDIPEYISRYKYKRIYFYQRPPELCTDTSLAWDVWRDAVKAAETHFGRTWDIHLYLEPTSPCRTKEDIQKCIDLIKSGKESVCAVSKAPTPEKFIRLEDNKVFCMDFDGFLNNKPRQLYSQNWYKKNGICYACTDERIKTAETMLDPSTHFLVIKRPVVNIDSEEDFLFAEALMNAGGYCPDQD